MPEDKDEWEPYSTTKRAYFIDRRAKKGSRYTLPGLKPIRKVEQKEKLRDNFQKMRM